MFTKKNYSEQSFTDFELQRIMEEIEGLEKELIEEKGRDTTIEEMSTMTELASRSQNGGPATHLEQSEIRGPGSKMALQLGDGQVCVKMDHNDALSVDLGNGFQLAITESGCTVTMENGTTFTIPLKKK